ncbi:membrane protein insertion efficiency factor YidD [Leucobacter exalbidus]|uniref:membrane protein insertion efficiency factor YidD n=1 Tax=Leucobacter exalbidus TaxID=662960 RepID=UPI001AE64F98|nr:membrane protein insertion efficiency factor YidD [Leucobacter exalbidus]
MIGFMICYRKLISPLYGEVCRYYPSCSRYSLEAYQQRGFIIGVALTAWRLVRCNPFSGGGIDDVPVVAHPRFTLSPRGFVRSPHRKA